MNSETENVGRPAVQVLTALAGQAHAIDDRLRFLQAVADTKRATLTDKLLALTDLLKAWQQQSMAMADVLPTFVAQLCVRHAEEFVGSDREASSRTTYR